MASQQTLLVLLLLCVMAAAASAGNTYSAGSNGWTLGSSMGSMTVSVGDLVKFTYPEGQHDVNSVSQDAYNSCDASSPYTTYKSGNDDVPFSSQGAYYFICSKEGHCGAGMKIAIYVK